MKVVLQRVKSSSVEVSGEITGSIEQGLLILLGIAEDDNNEDMDYILRKVINMRIFRDSEGKMNKSVLDIDGDILLVSQFTLCADTRKGNRPSFINAAKPEKAEKMYEEFKERLIQSGIKRVETGIFGAMMDVNIINDGPVTIVLDSRSV
jgi:D-tyrosyl-tRNA(Tyr) deacylase